MKKKYLLGVLFLIVLLIIILFLINFGDKSKNLRRDLLNKLDDFSIPQKYNIVSYSEYGKQSYFWKYKFIYIENEQIVYLNESISSNDRGTKYSYNCSYICSMNENLNECNHIIGDVQLCGNIKIEDIPTYSKIVEQLKQESSKGEDIFIDNGCYYFKTSLDLRYISYKVCFDKDLIKTYTYHLSETGYTVDLSLEFFPTQ